jgi:threonine aldolase
LLAEIVAEAGAIVDLPSVQTNIVVFTLPEEGDAPALVAKLKAEGVLTSVIGPHAVRLVTHFDVGREDCVRAGEILKRVMA